MPIYSDDIPKTAMADNPDMSTNRSDKVITEHAAYGADLQLLDKINAKTAFRFYDTGTWMNGTPNTDDIIIWIDSVTTTSGNAVFYLTSDRTSAGTAFFSYISSNSVDTGYIDSANMYAKSTPTVSPDLKTVTIPITKQTMNVVTVVGINVIGSVTMPSAGNGVTVKLFLMGRAV